MFLLTGLGMSFAFVPSHEVEKSVRDDVKRKHLIHVMKVAAGETSIINEDISKSEKK